MTKEELKKKIVEVVNQWHMFQNRDMNGHTIWLTNDSEKLADALIEAGIGDVAELADKWREMLKTQAEKTSEAERCAAAAYCPHGSGGAGSALRLVPGERD